MSTRRRAQAQKPNRHDKTANPVMAAAMREFRQGSRTTPVRLKSTYYRPKAKREGWDD